MKLPIHPTWLFLSMTLAVCAPAVPCELTDFQSLAEESPHGVTLASAERVTVVGKQFAEGYYARAPDHSYFRGCSTGGRQGLMAMQRYPGDFDGIIVGAPVFSPARMIVSGLWTTQQVARLIAEDQPLAGEQLELLKDAVLDACDAIDGIEDQIIDDPRQCRVDPGILQCNESESPPRCLTDSQVEFVRTIYDGPVTMSGERIYPGLLHGGEYGAGMGMGGWARFTAGACATPEESGQCDYLDYLAQVWYQDPDRDLLNDFSIDNPDDVVAADSSYYSAVTRADNPDVTPFVQRGGKAHPLSRLERHRCHRDTYGRTV